MDNAKMDNAKKEQYVDGIVSGVLPDQETFSCKTTSQTWSLRA